MEWYDVPAGFAAVSIRDRVEKPQCRLTAGQQGRILCVGDTRSGVAGTLGNLHFAGVQRGSFSRRGTAYMTPEHLYIDLSVDVQKVLADNHVDLAKLLHERGLEVQFHRMSDPATDTGTASKEPALVLVATAAVIVAATPIIREIIQTLSRRSVVVRGRKLVPVESSDGAVVRNAQNEPILQWINTAEIIEAPATASPSQKLSVKIPAGISISYETN